MQTTSETTPAAGNFEAEAVAGAAGARWAPGWLALVLVVAGMLAYANSLNGPLILDDWITLRVNPELDRVWPPWLMFMPSEGTGLGGRPIAHASFVLNRALTGPSLQSMHAGNTAIHIAAALALFGFVRRGLRLPRLRERFGAAADALGFSLALLWLLQPLQTESVTYISQRTESLMGLFYLLTLYAFIRAAGAPPPDTGNAPGGPRSPIRWQLLAVASCFAGAATKEVIATAPLLVFLYDRCFVTGTFAAAWRAVR